MLDQLEKGLIDFGIVFGAIEHTKYNSIPLSYKNTWGVLMRKDSPLAVKDSIAPEDLWKKPLILSRPGLCHRASEKFMQELNKLPKIN